MGAVISKCGIHWADNECNHLVLYGAASQLSAGVVTALEYSRAAACGHTHSLHLLCPYTCLCPSFPTNSPHPTHDTFLGCQRRWQLTGTACWWLLATRRLECSTTLWSSGATPRQQRASGAGHSNRAAVRLMNLMLQASTPPAAELAVCNILTREATHDFNVEGRSLLAAMAVVVCVALAALCSSTRKIMTTTAPPQRHACCLCAYVPRRARAASRHVQAWRDTIAAITPGVQQFETALLHPTKFSPWR